LGDSYVHFGLASVLVHLATHWHPVAAAWGIASLYLLAAPLPQLPLFVTSTIQGVSAGTGGRKPMVIIVAALVSVAVAGLTIVRIQRRSDQPSGPGRPGLRRPGPRSLPLSVAADRAAFGAVGADRVGAEPPVLVG
jgi:hypothetical protein